MLYPLSYEGVVGEAQVSGGADESDAGVNGPWPSGRAPV